MDAGRELLIMALEKFSIENLISMMKAGARMIPKYLKANEIPTFDEIRIQRLSTYGKPQEDFYIVFGMNLLIVRKGRICLLVRHISTMKMKLMSVLEQVLMNLVLWMKMKII